MDGLGISINEPKMPPVYAGILKDGDLNGIYSYCMTYCTSFGETIRGLESEKIKVKGTCSLLLPVSDNNHCKGKKLYRKEWTNLNSDYHLIKTLDNSVILFNDDIITVGQQLNYCDTSSSIQMLRGIFYFDKPTFLSTKEITEEKEIYRIIDTFNIITNKYNFDTVYLNKAIKNGIQITIINDNDKFIKCIADSETYYIEPKISVNLLFNNKWIILN